ncbi:amidohydrolase family protein [Gaetbulibacter sp. M240]|uniref:amidohydrolase family protein n=1 Tax=Gaetbulibacter sp. M240 TaxID=3126511 RepID=UPI00374ED053
MVIDSHQHFWKFDPVRDSWINDSMEKIKMDFLPKDLEPILKVNNVNGCIAVQADQSERETEFLLQCAAENSFIKGVVGWVDLTSENVEKRLRYYSKNRFFKGLRHIVQAEPDVNFMLRTDFLNGISKLQNFNLTYDILIVPNQLPAALELAKTFPKQKFILDHLGKPKISEGIDSSWLSHIEKLGALKNVYCKLSGLVTETKDLKWKKTDFEPFLKTMVSNFGTDRLLFGSDWPVCLLAASYKEVLNIISDFFKSFSTNEVENILGTNAVKIYDLEP